MWKGDRALVAVGRMLLEALDEVEYRNLGLRSTPEPMTTVQELALRGDECSRRGRCRRRPPPSHGGLHADVPAAKAEGDRRVLGALI